MVVQGSSSALNEGCEPLVNAHCTGNFKVDFFKKHCKSAKRILLGNYLSGMVNDTPFLILENKVLNDDHLLILCFTSLGSFLPRITDTNRLLVLGLFQFCLVR